MICKTLFRPVGLRELELICASGWQSFPPRLSWQPLFYPVLHPAYAEQIAREWNTKDSFSGYCGFVTSFDLPETFLEKYPVQNVGNVEHDELWVPASELEAFNLAIVGRIRLVKAFLGEAAVNSENKEVREFLVSQSLKAW